MAVQFEDSAGTVASRIEYGYDVFDRRVLRRVDADGDGAFETTEGFVYDQEDVLAVLDASGSLVTRYLHGPGADFVLAQELVGSALQPVGQASPPGVLWSLADHLGSTRTKKGDITDFERCSPKGEFWGHHT